MLSYWSSDRPERADRSAVWNADGLPFPASAIGDPEITEFIASKNWFIFNKHISYNINTCI